MNIMGPIAILAVIALSGCTDLLVRNDKVELEIAGPPIDSTLTRQAFLYAIPPASDGPQNAGLSAQKWSMLGREDRGAAVMSDEYGPAACESIAGSPSGWEEIL